MVSRLPEDSFLWRILVFPGKFRRYKFRLLIGTFQYYLLKRTLRQKLSLKRLRKNEITIVITSAGRLEYLKPTVESLRRYFDYDSRQTHWFIIDDYPQDENTRKYIKDLSGFDIKFFNERNRGLGYSLNKIYAEVETEFVFYCQDDWEFLRQIPVRQMMGILQENPDLAQVLLFREPIKSLEYQGAKELGDGFAQFDRIFSFNPHLTKTELFLRYYPFNLYFTEDEYTFKLRREGYRVSSVLGYGQSPYVRHIGKHWHVHSL